MKELQDTAKRLLEEGKVKLIIGFEEGTLPMRSSPVFVRSPEDADRLVFNSFSENNLASFLKYYTPSLEEGDAIGVICKGCDARSIICLLKEKQFKREQLVLIGVACRGMVDHKRIRREVSPEEVLEAREEENEIVIRTNSSEKRLKRSEYIYDNCRECTRKEPPVSDQMLSTEEREVETKEKWSRTKSFEEMSAEERWDYFVSETSRCLRCYACRNACPVCYCTECFVDSTMPYWVGTTLDPSDVQVFHLVRALHTAGRCTLCGNCTQVCPVGIDIAFLVGKLCKDVEELFSHEAGVNAEENPPLSGYSEQDPNKGFA